MYPTSILRLAGAHAAFNDNSVRCLLFTGKIITHTDSVQSGNGFFLSRYGRTRAGTDHACVDCGGNEAAFHPKMCVQVFAVPLMNRTRRVNRFLLCCRGDGADGRNTRCTAAPAVVTAGCSSSWLQYRWRSVRYIPTVIVIPNDFAVYKNAYKQ